jgi:uncharacterized membrane protein
MDPGNSVPSKRSRFLGALFKSIVISALFGFVGYVSGYVGAVGNFRSVQDIHVHAIMMGLNTTAVVFWILFAVLMLHEFSKSEAVLDLERRNRLAEELFKRDKEARATRGPVIPSR